MSSYNKTHWGKYTSRIILSVDWQLDKKKKKSLNSKNGKKATRKWVHYMSQEVSKDVIHTE